MALVGDLRDLKIPNLVQLNCMERNTAKLTIEHAGKFGTIYFQNGQIVHAEYDPDIGEKALYRMLSLEDGKFKVEAGVRPPLVTINAHWNNLLLEGLHKLDSLQQTKEGQHRKSVDRLMNVKGVTKAAIINTNGIVIASNFNSPKDFLLQAFTYLEMNKLSAIMNFESPSFTSLIVGKHRILQTVRDNNIVYIELESKYQLETTVPFIEKVLGQSVK